jgi:hypothetical protein
MFDEFGRKIDSVWESGGMEIAAQIFWLTMVKLKEKKT